MHRRRSSTAGLGLALALVIAGCGDAEQDNVGALDTGMAAPTTAAPAPTESTAAGTMLRVADITGNPDQYIGQTVTVEADVEEVKSAFAFELDEDAALAGGVDNELLVFSPQSAQLASVDDQWLNNRVRVSGTVRRMTVAELEREIGWDLEPELESELEDTRPVLIATSVERIPDSQ